MKIGISIDFTKIESNFCKVTSFKTTKYLKLPDLQMHEEYDVAYMHRCEHRK